MKLDAVTIARLARIDMSARDAERGLSYWDGTMLEDLRFVLMLVYDLTHEKRA